MNTRLRTHSRLAMWVAVAITALLAQSVTLALTESPSQAAPSTITFAALGDFGLDRAAHTEVANLMDSWDPDFIITMGDNRYDEGDSQFTYDEVLGKRYCDYLYKVKPGPNCNGGNASSQKFFPTTGNHDYGDGEGISEYDEYFRITNGKRYYKFTKGSVEFFAVDAGQNGGLRADKPAEAEQWAWLKNGLQNSRTQFQVVFFHHAPYSSAAEHGNNAKMQLPFKEWGADAVIAGHDHTYERIQRDGIVYFVNGLGGHTPRSFVPRGEQVSGSAARFTGKNGAMKITASSTEMTFEFYDVDGQQQDCYKLRQNGGSACAKRPPVDPPTTGNAPAKPAGFTVATYSTRTAELMWDRPSSNEALSYEVKRNGVVLSGRTGTTGISLMQRHLRDGTTYNYELRAINRNGKKSNPATLTLVGSSVSSSRPPVVDPPTNGNAPAQPTGFKVERYSSTAGELIWNRAPAGTVAFYEIKRNGSVVTDSRDGTSFMQRDLNRNATYSYELRAIGKDGTKSRPAKVTLQSD